MALDGELRKEQKYYVVGRRDKFVKMRYNLLLFLFICHISWQASKPYCFQGVKPTRNIRAHITTSDYVVVAGVYLRFSYYQHLVDNRDILV